jgi:hypothetical protein
MMVALALTLVVHPVKHNFVQLMVVQGTNVALPIVHGIIVGKMIFVVTNLAPQVILVL